MQKNPVGTQSPLKCAANNVLWCTWELFWASEKMWTFPLEAMLKQLFEPTDLLHVAPRCDLWKQATVAHFICCVFALGACYLRGCHAIQNQISTPKQLNTIKDWFDEAQITFHKIWMIPLLDTLKGFPVFEWHHFTDSLCVWLCAAKLESPDKGLCSKACQHPSWSLSLVRAIDHNTPLTQCRAGIESPGNCSICQIQQVANQNQPTCSMMVPEQNKSELGLAIWWQQPISKGEVFADSQKWKRAESSAG